MGATSIEILDVGFQQAVQMAFIADEQMIQTLAANAADKAFTNRVGARGTKRCFDDLNLGTSDDGGKVLTIFLTEHFLLDLPNQLLRSRALAGSTFENVRPASAPNTEFSGTCAQ